MQARINPLRRTFLLCAIAFTLPAISAASPQDPRNQQPSGGPQTRPAPPQRPSPGGGTPGGGNPGRPNPGNGGPPPRPNPGNGGPQIQPIRPNPGNGGPQIQPPRPSRPQPPRPNPGNGNYRPPRPGRPPGWGRPPQNRPSYQFRPRDRDYLRRHYLRHLSYINRARRPIFTIGGYFPYGDIGYLSPLPPNLYGYLPPPPPGYQMGYFDGYVVVYDPVTYFIANLVDLLQ